MAPAAAAPAAGRQLVGAGVEETRGGAEEAVQEMADGGGEGRRLHILSDRPRQKSRSELSGLSCLDPVHVLHLEKRPEDVLGAPDDDLAQRNPLWKRTPLKRRSCNHETNPMVLSHNLYVAEPGLLLHPLQLPQQGAQVADVHPSPVQRRRQGQAVHRGRRAVQEVLQLPQGHTGGVRVEGFFLNRGLTEDDSHHSWDLVRQQEGCGVPQQQLLLVDLGGTLGGEPDTFDTNETQGRFDRSSGMKTEDFKHI